MVVNSDTGILTLFHSNMYDRVYCVKERLRENVPSYVIDLRETVAIPEAFRYLTAPTCGALEELVDTVDRAHSPELQT